MKTQELPIINIKSFPQLLPSPLILSTLLLPLTTDSPPTTPQRPIIFYLAHLNTQKEQNMQNEPNFSKSQMFTTIVKKRNYSEKCTMDTWSKQTQTKPILPAYGKLARRSLGEGGKNLLYQFYDLLEFGVVGGFERFTQYPFKTADISVFSVPSSLALRRTGLQPRWSDELFGHLQFGLPVF